MKNLTLVLLILFSFFTLQGKERVKDKVKGNKKVQTSIDADSLKLRNDLHEGLLEFIADTKMNPDSCYVPF
jgi:hypothetical protein